MAKNNCMKRIFGLLLVLLFSLALVAQQDVKTLQETARGFTKQGDFPNALFVLNRALEMEPNNLSVNKDLALVYYQKSDYPAAQKVLNKLMERPDADAAVFQMAAMLFKSNGEVKEADKIYKKGLKLFPQSGALLNEYGELLWAQKDFTAIRQWEKGIEVDPNYSRNYYNAARYYYFTVDKVWSLVYGEMFVNMESYTQRTAEIKGLLLESYKKLFTEADMQRGQDGKNPFVQAFLGSNNKQSTVAMNGITPESLTMIRTRFVLDWFEKSGSRFPFRLFEYQRQLLKEGVFDAYNQWLFGSTQNLSAYQNWTTTHSDEYAQFTGSQRTRMFKLPLSGQYYQSPNYQPGR
jgi:Tfp pilus assembly protein PilF